jgi:peptide/nickel transport system permease protein
MTAGWLARPGWFPLPLEPSWLRWAIALVVLSWTSGALSEASEILYDSLTSLARAPFVDALRARGEPVAPVVRRHLLPVLADLVARRVPAAFGALVFVDPLLGLGGLGLLLWRAAQERDLDVAFAAVTVIAVVVAATRLAADLIGLVIDPRRRTTSWR